MITTHPAHPALVRRLHVDLLRTGATRCRMSRTARRA